MHISQALIVSVSVYRGHQTLLNTDLLVQRFYDRGKAVCGARGIRNNQVGLGEGFMIDAVYHCGVHVFSRCRDKHALRASEKMFSGRFAVGEQPGTLKDDINREITPGQLCGVTFGEDADAVASHDHIAALCADRMGKASMSGIELRQVRVHLGRAQVIDRHQPHGLA